MEIKTDDENILRLGIILNLLNKMKQRNNIDQPKHDDVRVQEVTLRKNNSDERIGLTVSYSSGNGSGSGSDDAETCTEVYISDIQVDSVAARDGRLRQGDQILQVSIIIIASVGNQYVFPFSHNKQSQFTGLHVHILLFRVCTLFFSFIRLLFFFFSFLFSAASQFLIANRFFVLLIFLALVLLMSSFLGLFR